MSIKINVCYGTNANALNQWKTQENITNYTELLTVLKSKPYSMANFGDILSEKGSQRHNGNIKSFNNVLIYDIDNDPAQAKLSLEQAKELLQKHDISAIIIPSKSHQIEKFTATGKSKGVVDRYRIIIPTKTALNSNDIQVYKEFQKIATKALGLEQFLDKQVSQNPTTFYFPSPANAQPIIVKSRKVLKIENFEKAAFERVEKIKVQKLKEVLKIEQLKSDLHKFGVQKEFTHPSGNNVHYCDTNKIMSLDIKGLIVKLKPNAEAYQEGSYSMIKTDNAKYSIVGDNVAHDFKASKTYNNISFLQEHFQTQNLNKIAKELEKITGQIYLQVNYQKIEEQVRNALRTAKNDNEFEAQIKEAFGVKFVKIEPKAIQIANEKIEYEKINLSKQELVKNLVKNRDQNQSRYQELS